MMRSVTSLSSSHSYYLFSNRAEFLSTLKASASVSNEINSPPISVTDSAVLKSAVGFHSRVSHTLRKSKASKKRSRRSLQEVGLLLSLVRAATLIDCVIPKTPQNENCFVKDYMEMKPTSQWTLANKQGERGKGRVVEKILYDYYKEKEQESLAHSWVIELDAEVNPEIRSLFTDEEWQEICEEKPSDLLMVDACLAESMIRFSGVSKYSMFSSSDTNSVLQCR